MEGFWNRDGRRVGERENHPLTSCVWVKFFNPFSTTRRYKRRQNKVEVKGLGRNGSYLVGFSIFFHGSMKKFNELA